MRMRFCGIVGLLALVSASTAGAADLPLPAKAPPPSPIFNWTGFYIGGNGGGGWSHSNYTESSVGTSVGPGFAVTTTTAGSGSQSGSGGLAGGQIGYNYELPSHVVLGIEADADWAHISGSANGCSTYTGSTGGVVPIVIGSVAGCGTTSNVLNDFGTVRGRLGYAFNNVLLFGTGGWAWGNSSGNETTTCVSGFPAACPGAGIGFTGGSGSFSSSTTSGWTAGAGLEWGFLPHWSARVEYLHLQFDNVSTNVSATVFSVGSTGNTTTNISSNAGIDVVRVGVNYLFN